MTFGIEAVHARIAQLDPNWARARATTQAPAASTAPALDRSATMPSSFASAFENAIAVQDHGHDHGHSHGVSATSPAATLLAASTPGSGGTLGVPYGELFERAGTAHGVDPALLAAVAYAESNYTPTAVSHAGAEGLMQLMPATAEGLGVTNSFDPEQAVDGAARLLAGHIRTFGSVELALAAYNAGGGAVQRHGGIPPYAETQAYVPKVMAKYQELL